MGFFCLQKSPGAVNSNQMTTNKLALRLGRVLEMMLRGPACFDFENYLKANPDLVALPSREHIWMQFVLEDQFLGRKFWCESLPACHDNNVMGHQSCIACPFILKAAWRCFTHAPRHYSGVFLLDCHPSRCAQQCARVSLQGPLFAAFPSKKLY